MECQSTSNSFFKKKILIKIKNKYIPQLPNSLQKSQLSKALYIKLPETNTVHRTRPVPFTGVETLQREEPPFQQIPLEKWALYIKQWRGTVTQPPMTNRQKPKFKNWKPKRILEENMGQKVHSPGSLGNVSLDYYLEVRDSNNQYRQNWVQENFKLLTVKTDREMATYKEGGNICK